MNNYDSRSEFVHWLSGKLPTLSVNLDIKASAAVPGGLKASCHGIEQVLERYAWRAKWLQPDGSIETSTNWYETKCSVGKLRAWLKSTTNPDDLLSACTAVIQWGGGARNRGKGADLFFAKEGAALAEYLVEAKQWLSLENSTPVMVAKIELMNSMITKVHAFFADDGLPIYDSRVACSISCLVEQYRQEVGVSWESIGSDIRFPIPAFGKLRSVKVLYSDAPITVLGNPGVQRSATTAWAQAKVNLGRVMRATLMSNENILSGEGDLTSRMHALEAALFMIGYNAACLRGS